MTTERLKPVLVTTEQRGVFFGYLADDNSPNSVTLRDCRNVIYWTREVSGFLGLAQRGPIDGCRVSPAALESKLIGITSISVVTPEAEKAFKEFVWKG